MDVVALVALLLLSGFFSGSEAAFLSLGRIRLRHRIEQGEKKAIHIAKMLENIERFLGTILVGNTLVNVALSAIATGIAIRYFGPTRGITVATIGVTIILLVVGELAPKTLAASKPRRFAYAVIYPLQSLSVVLRPVVAVVTNTHPAHLEGFGSLETIVREKVSIAEGLSEEGVLIVNADIEPLAAAARETGKPLRRFGTSPDADYRVENVTHAGFSSTFTIGGQEMHLPLPGPGNVHNALAAWAVCDRLGVTLEQFAAALESLSGVAMRAEPVQIAALTVINDCYNANPASMNNALAVLGGLRGAPESAGSRRLVFICGEMAELGPQTEALHAELGKAVARAGVDVLLTVGEPPKATARLAREAARHDLQVRCFDDTPAVCDNLETLIEKDDIILVKGSRTARLERVVDRLHELFAGAADPHRMQKLPTSPERR